MQVVLTSVTDMFCQVELDGWIYPNAIPFGNNLTFLNRIPTVVDYHILGYEDFTVAFVGDKPEIKDYVVGHVVDVRALPSGCEIIFMVEGVNQVQGIRHEYMTLEDFSEDMDYAVFIIDGEPTIAVIGEMCY